MKINNKFICIPPYLSTSWENVHSLTVEDAQLIITLTDESIVSIPDLKGEQIENIFHSHLEFLESNPTPSEQAQLQVPGLPAQIAELLQGGSDQNANTMSFGISLDQVNGMENMSSMLQHSQEQSHTPDLPPEMLHKIASIAQIMIPDGAEAFPKPEPHCNCMHCQIGRAIHNDSESVEIVEEETIDNSELTFREWDIKEDTNEHFVVSNPFDSSEQYHVSLANEVLGCTCGASNCEHLVAVLRS
jgi:hypothetical protein